MVETFDQELRKPDADTLARIISSTDKPVLIMLDELVNYLKDSKAEMVGDQNLVKLTVAFFHTLSDVIANSKNAMLILTLPGSESVYKEEAELLEQFKTEIKELSGRGGWFTVPMERSEIYDVIRKRLFRSVDHQYATDVAEQLQKFYAEHQESFPADVMSLDYRTKTAKSYPFHPALVDLLYERVATIAEFQKTRGVLRLLSHVLKNIYQNIDAFNSDPIITPGIIDLNDFVGNDISGGKFKWKGKEYIEDVAFNKIQENRGIDNTSFPSRHYTYLMHRVLPLVRSPLQGVLQNEIVRSYARLLPGIGGVSFGSETLFEPV